MSLADEVIALKFGTEEFFKLRAAAIAGDPEALKKYVYFCALRELQRDEFVLPDQKLKIFRQIVQADAVEVTLG